MHDQNIYRDGNIGHTGCLWAGIPGPNKGRPDIRDRRRIPNVVGRRNGKLDVTTRGS
jgi:hypothetical protein